MHPIMLEFFRYPKFSETLNGCPQIFLALWDKKLSTKNCDTLSCIKFFDYLKLSETLKGCLRSFRHNQAWSFRQKNVYALNMQKNLRYHNFSETLQGCSINFSTLWDQIFSTKRCDTPLFNPLKRFETRLSLKNSRIPVKNYSALWDREFLTEKRYTLYFAYKISITPNFMKPLRDAHDFFRHCHTWNFRQKTWYPLFCINFSDTAFFLKYCRDADEIFRLCEANVSRRKNIIPHFLIRRNFSKRENLTRTVGFVYKTFR